MVARKRRASRGRQPGVAGRTPKREFHPAFRDGGGRGGPAHRRPPDGFRRRDAIPARGREDPGRRPRRRRDRERVRRRRHPGGSTPTPDQNDVDEIGRAYGLQEEDNGSCARAARCWPGATASRTRAAAPEARRYEHGEIFLTPAPAPAWTPGLPVSEWPRHDHRPPRRARAGDRSRRAKAGELLRADLHRPAGRGAKWTRPRPTPRPSTSSAPAARRRSPAGATWARRRGASPATPGAPMWLVDPNDGTRDYLVGRRGSAVSIALLWARCRASASSSRSPIPDDAGTSSPGPRAAGRCAQRPAGRAAP